MSREFPIVLVKNLPYKVSTSSMYEFFGQFGNINQIRISNEESTQGSCFIIYSNLANAIRAANELNGVNFQGRYLVTSLYPVDKSLINKEEMILRKEQLSQLKQQYSIQD
ncbi:uncharacterized protein SPAPADRAFT_56134 [Spathaspora passalidarum NRRL Y-27907]|uniref:RRM domain-containing protein n=1 Tax=Spathaspora passalidarum (strain NRRL Y-27907 / 11-Y1) TaxID=619300 RepID=G3AR74_SPAPN|nr:uncharacterized protein SPAPADRAFT_56134 [Spathaspora passalidarum NRRL Y-27907]EGW31249.1 hypothetical protein SPAPADRAFT_56134 [Spathaspora passalidarum NRRL Y-27907]